MANPADKQNQEFLKGLHGFDQKYAVNSQQRIRDPRGRFQRLHDDYKEKGNEKYPVVAWGLLGAMVILPFLFIPLIIILAIYTQYVMRCGKEAQVPFFATPINIGEENLDDGHFYDNEGNKLKGCIYFGQEMATGKEIYLDEEEARRHMLLMGTTGAGKTEAIRSLCFSFVLNGSGFSMCDAKGTYALYYDMYSLARSMGRDDDVLLMNFLTGDQNVRETTEVKVSNTIDLIGEASHTGMTQTIMSLVAGGDEFWKGRAAALLSAQTAVMTYQRDKWRIPASLMRLEDLMSMTNLANVYLKAKEVAEDSENYNPNSPDYLPEYIIRNLFLLLESIGYNPAVPVKEQHPDVEKQFNYMSMQFTKILGSLTGEYGYIFNTEGGEINLRDILLNRRILVQLLPSLEKSQSELRQLGGITVTAWKQAFVSLLGDKVEGEIASILESSPTRSRIPFFWMNDEWGQIATEGASVIPAQARALGVCAGFAGQDKDGFMKGDPKDAESTIKNLGIHIGMKLKDAESTYEIFAKKAGQVDLLMSTGKNATKGSFSEENTHYSYQKVNLIDYKDFEAQKEGMAHLIMGGKVVRSRFMYVNIKPKSNDQIFVNQFLSVPRPTQQDIDDLRKNLEFAKNELLGKTHTISLAQKIDGADKSRMLAFAKLVKEARIRQKEFMAEYQAGPLISAVLPVAAESYRQYQKHKEQIERAEQASNKAKLQVSTILSDELYKDVLNHYLKEAALYSTDMGLYGLEESEFIEVAEHCQAQIDGNPASAKKMAKLAINVINQIAYPKNTIRTPNKKMHLSTIKQTTMGIRQARLGIKKGVI